jgi:hypothetical protein
VDYSCYKCGQAIAEGTHFCPHCGAPQIRVTIPEPSAPAGSPPFAPGTPAEMQPPAHPVNLSLRGDGINWTIGRTSVVMAGIFIGITSFLPLNFLWIPAGGLLAVKLYNKRTIPPLTSTGDGAKLGALAGLAGYVIVALATIAILHFYADKFWKLLDESVKARAASSGTDLKPVLEMLNTAQGKTFLVTFMMVFVFVMMLALSSVGGALGAMFANRGQRR